MSKAIITISGNRMKGYVMVVSIPKDWLQLFVNNRTVVVWSEMLGPTWGEGESHHKSRMNRASFDDLEKAVRSSEMRREEIEAAKRALKETLDINITQEVEL